MEVKVFVLNQKGKPLMPARPQKAKKLLKKGKAKVVRRTPFTIQLNYPTGENKQEITVSYSNFGVNAV